MALAPRLELRQATALVMTPLLQQAIKLLQMSNQELCAFVAEEIDANPLLEGAEGFAFSQSGTTPQDKDAKREEQAEAPNEREASSDDFEHAGPDFSASEDYQAERVADKPSLRDHLLSQIHMDFLDPRDRMAAAALVECLDEAGYLPADLTLVRTQLGLTHEAFERLVARLQKLDPLGIFARNLAECLSIQLRDKNRLDPAMEMLLKHLNLLAKRERERLMRLCGVDAEDLDDMIAEIKALSPKPAMAYASDVAPPIVPDVFILPAHEGGWNVVLNEATLPRVLVNETFYARVREGEMSIADKAYVTERWQQANWLVKALRQRAMTILKVASEIVKQQDKFFIYGVQYLKPLILRDIATAVELHESTVSRVTQNKYISTPRGLFELKYFFSTALGTTGGIATVSTTAVRERIKELIEAEKPSEILSDDRLAAILRREGIDVARRTVAKYRESLKIPTSAQRKRDKKGANHRKATSS